jgi:hypothetical protein
MLAELGRNVGVETAVDVVLEHVDKRDKVKTVDAWSV